MNRFARSPLLRWLLALLALCAPVPAQGREQAADLTRLTIEDLMNIEITSASRKEQSLSQVPAAVFVLTQDDIRRSGMTTVPELLRLVPGVQVAQINANKWAIAIRGFNNLFSDKLLVLVDGRTVYDRLNSGVFWESIDIPFDEIDRIEVIRGAGGATWGSNAVNGVISIVTSSAADTPGVAVTVGAGTFDGARISGRYGGMLGTTAYRIASQWVGHGESRLDADTPASDEWQSQTHLLRLDWGRGENAIMVESSATLARLRGLFPAPSGPVPSPKPPWNDTTTTEEYNLQGRWRHGRDGGPALQVQSYLHYRHNDDAVNPRQTQLDVDAQYHTRIATRHDVVAGAGYRFLDENTDGSFGFAISPSQVDETILNVFAQDDIAVGSRLTITLGAKVERDAYVGWDIQPTARVIWSVVPRRQQAWASLSRAVRSPSLGDASGRYNFTSFIGQAGVPVVVGAIGNPAFQSEEVLSTDIGYRVAIGSAVSVDATAFYGRYDHLKTSEPLEPRIEFTPAPVHLFIPTQFENRLQATTAGVEVSARLTPLPWWRLEGGFSTFHLAPELSPTSGDTAAASFDGNAPRAQWQARSALTLPAGMQIDAMFFHSGALPGLGVGSYTRADLRVEARLTKRLTGEIVGQNLFDPLHAEYAGAGAIVAATLIPRSVRIQLTWRQ